MCKCQYCSTYRNYVYSGKGIGLKWAFLFAFLTGLAVAVLATFTFPLLLNGHDFDSFVETLPVVKIQDGRIVEPIYNNQIWVVPNDDSDFVVVVNTTVDSVDTLPQGVNLYVTAKNIYIQSDGDIGKYSVPSGDMVITHDVFRKMVSIFWGVIGVMLGIVAIVMGLFSFLISYCLVLLLGFLFNKKISSGGWGRALTYPWGIVWAIFAGFSLSGVPLFGITTYPLAWIAVISALITFTVGVFIKNKDDASVTETVEEIEEETLNEDQPTEEPKRKTANKKEPVAAVVQKRAKKSSSAKKAAPVKKGAVEKKPAKKTPQRSKKASKAK